MTQLSLFDSASMHSAGTPVVASPEPSVAEPAVAGPAAVAVAAEPSVVEAGDGVQRMGDLARLVLLRYQLVAQRRAAMAARQQASL